jgi:inner membrane protein
MAASVAGKKESRSAAVIGFAAALLADADVFISASDDTLLNVEFHRHFTHALIFIPVGALLASLLLWPLLRKRLGFKRIYWYALLGYATSGLLDACTSYGTHLLWPFSDTRIAWSIIAIVDPVFSVVLLIALILGFKYCKPKPARIGLGLAGAYLMLGVWQHHNALQVAIELAEARGHTVQRILVKPTMANLVLWRSVYQSDDRFYVDAIRVGFGQARIYAGESAARFDPARDLADLDTESMLSDDIGRFQKLADGYVIADPTRSGVLTDIRYSMLPTGITPMWGIDLNVASATQHARFEVYRDRPEQARERFTAMLLGRDLPE